MSFQGALEGSTSLSDHLIDVLCYNKLSEEASVSLSGPDGAACQGNSS